MTHIEQIKNLFFLELEKKNSWGKNEVKTLYYECCMSVLSTHLDELLKDNKQVIPDENLPNPMSNLEDFTDFVPIPINEQDGHTIKKAVEQKKVDKDDLPF